MTKVVFVLPEPTIYCILCQNIHTLCVNKHLFMLNILCYESSDDVQSEHKHPNKEESCGNLLFIVAILHVQAYAFKWGAKKGKQSFYKTPTKVPTCLNQTRNQISGQMK